MAGVFDGEAALQDGLCKVSRDPECTEDGDDDESGLPIDGIKMREAEPQDDGTSKECSSKGAEQALPAFGGADVGDHFVFAEDDAEAIRTHVGELRDHDNEEQQYKAVATAGWGELNPHEEAIKDNGVDDAKNGGKDPL